MEKNEMRNDMNTRICGFFFSVVWWDFFFRCCSRWCWASFFHQWTERLDAPLSCMLHFAVCALVLDHRRGQWWRWDGVVEWENRRKSSARDSWKELGKLAKPSVIPIDLTVKLDHQWTSHKNVSAGDDSLALAQPRLSSFLHIAHFSLLFYIFLNEISVRINGYKWDEWGEKRESEENDRQKKRFRSGRSSRVGAYQREIVVLLCTCGSRVRTGKTVLKFFIILYWIALMGSISGWWWSHTDLHWSSCRLQLTFLSALLLSFSLCCLSDRSNGGKLCVEHWKTWIQYEGV